MKKTSTASVNALRARRKALGLKRHDVYCQDDVWPDVIRFIAEGPAIQIGDFTLYEGDRGLSIYRSGGEGGTFSIDAFEEVVRKFYAENF